MKQTICAVLVICLFASGCVFYKDSNKAVNKFGVVIKTTPMINSYLLEQKDGEVEWKEAAYSYELQRGDLVYIKKEVDDKYVVYLIDMQPVWIGGKIKKRNISFNENDIQKLANVGSAKNAKLYSAPEGVIVDDSTSSRVSILQRDGDWYECILAGGDEKRYWIRKEDISFSFDCSTIPDL